MRAVGFTCGIGSMLVGARQAGFSIVGNIEWRRYYHHRDGQGQNTFEQNFPGAFFKKSLLNLNMDEVKSIRGIDLAMGHPECGNYSILNQLKEKKSLPGDIPIFVDLVKTIKPRFFVQDNLPGSLHGYTIQQWGEELPEYDLFPEWVCNWGYGNVQRSRNRFFIIGALKSEKFVFIPGEQENRTQLGEILRNVDGLPNQDCHIEDGPCGKVRLNISGKKYGEKTDRFLPGGTWREFREYFEDKPDGHVMLYVTQDGTIRRRMGTSKGYLHKHSHLLDGSSPLVNPQTNLPFSIRERCRIQGLPDDFQIYGVRYEPDGTWDHAKNTPVIKQTGKCMPVQFCRYVSQQIADHINGVPRTDSGRRILKPNPLISEAKKWICEQRGGYSAQGLVCKACWIHPCQKGIFSS